MKKKNRKIALGLMSTITILIISISMYFGNYYHADGDVVDILKISSVEENDNYVFLPSKEVSDKAIVFYPGGKVEHYSYLPLMDKFTEIGFNCYLVKMPFNLAIFNKNAADEIIEKNQNIKDWYMAGHSLGGAMASSYAEKNKSLVKGLILLGSYNYGDYNEKDTLIIYGSNDKILNQEKIGKSDIVKIINGGNHSYFGNYGEQKGDGKAIISREDQQCETVDMVVEKFNKP